MDKKQLFLTLKERLEQNKITDEEFNYILKLANNINKIKDSIQQMKDIISKAELELDKKENHFIGLMENLKYNTD